MVGSCVRPNGNVTDQNLSADVSTNPEVRRAIIKNELLTARANGDIAAESQLTFDLLDAQDPLSDAAYLDGNAEFLGLNSPKLLVKNSLQLDQMRDLANAEWDALSLFDKGIALSNRVPGAGTTKALNDVMLLERAYNAAPDIITEDYYNGLTDRFSQFVSGGLELAPVDSIALRDELSLINMFYQGEQDFAYPALTSGEQNYLTEQNLRFTNNMVMSVSLPSAAFGMASRWAGMSEQQVYGAVEFGAILNDMGGASVVLRPRLGSTARAPKGAVERVVTNDKSVTFGSMAPPARQARPSWRQSELDLEAMYGQHGYSAQESFLKGVPVKHGTRDSTRPDLYKTGESIDIKNYNLTNSRGRSNLVRDVSAQAQHRVQHLPPGDVQKVVLDVRGQNVSTSTLNNLAGKIQQKSNGILTTNNIHFWR